MKNLEKRGIIFLVLFVIFFLLLGSVSSVFSQSQTDYQIKFGLKITYAMWDNSGLSEYFGGTPLFGAFVEKKTSSDFKIGGFGDFGVDSYDEISFNFSQFGGIVKYSWYDFGIQRPNIYSGLGVSAIFLKLSDSSDTGQGNSFGFHLLSGIEIPINDKNFFDLGVNFLIGRVNIWDENLDIGNIAFNLGIIF